MMWVAVPPRMLSFTVLPCAPELGRTIAESCPSRDDRLLDSSGMYPHAPSALERRLPGPANPCLALAMQVTDWRRKARDSVAQYAPMPS